MKQKIYEHHFKVEVNGGLKGIDLDAIIGEVEREAIQLSRFQPAILISDSQVGKIMMHLFISSYLLRNLNISSALDNH